MLTSARGTRLQRLAADDGGEAIWRLLRHEWPTSLSRTNRPPRSALASRRPYEESSRAAVRRLRRDVGAVEHDAHIFTTRTGKPLNLSNFQRDVWAPAREAVFAEGDPLRGARRHDLRHAAITA